jgi:hypothetical protein
MTIDETTDDILRDESAQSEAIKSLITIKPHLKGESSEVELKTDLSGDEVKAHTIISIVSQFLEKSDFQFKDHCILNDLVNKKERKAWSKDRKSREEIVAVSRQPEFSGDMGQDVRKEGFIRRLFTPRKQP